MTQGPKPYSTEIYTGFIESPRERESKDTGYPSLSSFKKSE